MIHLEKITEKNFIDAFGLKLAAGQERFVSHPIRSLAQAYVYREQCQPFGIYDEEVMVGYVMVIYDYDIPEYDLWHMMIDVSKQGRGYGRARAGSGPCLYPDQAFRRFRPGDPDLQPGEQPGASPVQKQRLCADRRRRRRGDRTVADSAVRQPPHTAADFLPPFPKKADRAARPGSLSPAG